MGRREQIEVEEGEAGADNLPEKVDAAITLVICRRLGDRGFVGAHAWVAQRRRRGSKRCWKC
jgi:hypothetical protein